MNIFIGMLRAVYVQKNRLWQSECQLFYGGQSHRIFYEIDEIKRK